MSTTIEYLDVVRVIALLEGHREFIGTEGACRAPRIGDLAAEVHVLDPGQSFVAEAVDGEGGYTLWLADFSAEELQLEIKYRASA